MSKRTISFAAGAAFVAAAGMVALFTAGGAGGAPVIPPVLVQPDRAAADLTAIAAEAPIGQQAAFANGRITMAEYEGAVGATTRCIQAGIRTELEQRGWLHQVALTIDPVRRSEDGFRLEYSYGFRFAVGFDAASLPRSVVESPHVIEAGCRRDHLDALERAYQLRLLADPGYVRDVEHGFLSCMQAGGYAIRPETTSRQLLADLAAQPGGLREPAMACLGRFPAVVGAPS